MGKRSKKMCKKIFIGLVIIAILLLGINCRTQVWAIFDPDTAVHIDAASIDNSTLIIGTHLIYLGSLNDSIYAAAMTSAQDSNQNNMYYKSELADGGWFDITDAGSLEDIMGSGMRVEDAIINALAITHYTKADGITYDLRNNKKVSIFDIEEIYELETMPELEPLKLQYDRLKEAKGEKQEYFIKIISYFFRTTPSELLSIKKDEVTMVHTKETEDYDQKMLALQHYYEVLKNNGAAAAETDAVLKVMSKLDSTRRAIVYGIIETSLVRLTELLQDTEEVNDTLIAAAEESKVNITDSLREYEDSSLAAGATVMSNMEYTLEMELITETLNKNHSNCDAIVAKLISLQNIMNGKIVSKTSELETATELVAQMDEVYKQSLQKGIDDAYKKAVEARSSHVILENIISSNTVTWNVLRSELQFYVQAKIDRLDNEDAQKYIMDRIGSSGNFRIVIPLDAFQSSARGTVETYVVWLQKLLKNVSGEGDISELDQLYEEKIALQEEQMTALDQEDIREAKKIEAKIQAKSEEINRMEEAAASDIALLAAQKTTLEAKLDLQTEDLAARSSLTNQIADLQQQIAEAGSKLSDESTAQNIQNMKQEALKLVEKGDMSSNKIEELSGYINGIGSFLGTGSELALNAQKEIYKAMLTSVYLKEQAAYDPLVEQIEDQIENNMGNQKSNTYTAAAALAAIEDALGESTAGTGGSTAGTGGSDAGVGGSTTGTTESITAGAVMVEADSMSQNDILAAIAALAEYGDQTDSTEIKSLAAGLAASIMKEANSGAFAQLNSVNGKFAPVSALAAYMNYRYLWNDTKKTAVVANGLSYYRFTAFHNTVERNEEQTDAMSVAAEFRKTVYIPSDYLYKEFGCQVFNITGTDYAILIDDEIIKKQEELLEILQQP